MPLCLRGFLFLVCAHLRYEVCVNLRTISFYRQCQIGFIHDALDYTYEAMGSQSFFLVFRVRTMYRGILFFLVFHPTFPSNYGSSSNDLYLFQFEMIFICTVGSGFISDRCAKSGYEVNPGPTTARQTVISIISNKTGINANSGTQKRIDKSRQLWYHTV